MNPPVFITSIFVAYKAVFFNLAKKRFWVSDVLVEASDVSLPVPHLMVHDAREDFL
jgi:hypothetical protein